MKKLTKILLINWLHYSKQLIEVGDINFLTGKNSSGKSTVIDALQIVLLGELNERNFNKAANEKSQRSLDGYLRADSDDKNPKSRRGKDFSSYIACQFSDDQSGSSFVCGIVFDCRNDGSRSERFFIYDGVIPAHNFLINRQAMDITALRGYLKTSSETRGILYDRNSLYRSDLLAKWNVHNEQIFRTLKKAVSYTPVNDIQKFITENICDLPDRPDIESMQQNIRDYKRHEMLAQRQEEKLTLLTEISDLYRTMQAAIDRMRIHKFLMLWSRKEDISHKIEKLSLEKQDCENGIETERENCDNLETLITKADLRKNELIADRAKSDVFQEQNRLREQKHQLLQEQKTLAQTMNKMILEIKAEAQALGSLCDKISSWPKSELAAPLLEAAETLSHCCRQMGAYTIDIFSGALTPFEQAQGAVHVFSACLRETAYQLGEKMSVLKDELDQQNAILERLNNDVKDYPKALLLLKSRLEAELLSEFKHQVSVQILADVLEIAEGEEAWRGAIEGYLNTQKLYLLVDPKFYSHALTVFDNIKREFGKQSFGLVDIEKLREKEKLVSWDDSLAKIVVTDDPLARSYIDYLLGRVVRCAHTSQLRKHRTAITKEGMLYHGYVARPISKELMDNAFIGRKAVALRIEKIKAQITALGEEIRIYAPLCLQLDTQKNREFIFTKRFTAEAEQRQIDHVRGLEINRELDGIEKKLSGLDLFWLTNLDSEIRQLEDELKSLRTNKDECVKKQAKLEERLRKLEYEDLPESNQLLTENEALLDEDFSTQYRENVGLPRYRQELKRLKQPSVVANNFGQTRLSQTVGEVESSKLKLFQTRNEYLRQFQPCSFRADAMDNTEFDDERKHLEESELPSYRDRIKKARESALEQFQNDFLAKLKSSIDQVVEQVKNLNRALDGAPFGTDKYRFIVGRSPDESEYYDMIMAPELMDGDGGLFALAFQEKYGALIEDLFGRIATSDDTQPNSRKQSELQQNIIRYTDYRTYLKFDLETTDLNGSKQLLSQTMNTKSGGETQTPFYIAVLASFAQLYRVNDMSRFGNTVRLVIFDEAFNKMDSERIIESIRLLRKMRLQAIICAPPDKLADIMPEVDNTLLTIKEKYTMQILPYNKEIVDTWNES